MKKLIHFYFILLSYNYQMSNKMINIQIALTLIFLVLILMFFQASDADIFVQDYLFEVDTKTWLLDKHDKFYSFIFYGGAKKLLIAFGVIVLFSLSFLRKFDWVSSRKKGLTILLTCLIVTPLTIGSLKAATNTPCPKDINHYGGIYPDVKVFDKYPLTFKQTKKAKCFPAGHASGGFALLGLVFVFKRRKNQVLAFIFAQYVGWSMGLYKMLIGDHFLSHTIVTMLIAWFVALVSAKVVFSYFNYAFLSASQFKLINIYFVIQK